MAFGSGQRKTGNQVRRTGVVIAIVLALAFVVFQTSPLVKGTFTPVRAGMDDIIIQTSGVTQVSAQDLAASKKDLLSEVEELRVENRQLAIWRDTAISMAERMQRYEEMLQLVGEPLPNGVSARVVTETDGPFAESRLANAGVRNGVQVGHIAINTQGVIGRVVRVGNRSSRILLVSDFNSRVPVMGEISGVRAMLAGGKGDRVGDLVDQPENADFIAGENLLTTGEGSAFLRGLRIGRAMRSGDVWQAQLVLGDAPLDFVRLLPSSRFIAPEDDPVVDVETIDEPATVSDAPETAEAGQ